MILSTAKNDRLVQDHIAAQGGGLSSRTRPRDMGEPQRDYAKDFAPATAGRRYLAACAGLE